MQTTVVQVDVAQGGNLEARARACRYRAFDALPGETPILTAHTAEDQAETLLMRLADGAGISGLAGILAARGRLRRPWLSVARARVRAYAREHALPVIDDPANASLRFRRSALRVVAGPPLTEALGETWALRAALSAKHAAEAAALIEALGQPWLAHLCAIPLGVRLSAEGLAGPTVIRAWLIRRMLSTLGAGGRRVRQHLEHVLAVVDGRSAAHTLPGGACARMSGGGLEITRAAVPATPLTVVGPGVWAFGSGRLSLEWVEGLPEHRGAGVVARLAGVWRFRPPQPGDRYRPLGAPGSRALGRALRDGGVPARLRATCPVLEVDGVVVWAAGLRVAAEAAVPSSGGPAARIEWSWGP